MHTINYFLSLTLVPHHCASADFSFLWDSFGNISTTYIIGPMNRLFATEVIYGSRDESIARVEKDQVVCVLYNPSLITSSGPYGKC